MAGNLHDIDTSDAPELGEGFKAFPPGEYQLYMESSEVKDTSKGDGRYLQCQFVVAAGDCEGSKVRCNFNFWNNNATAVEIARTQWRALCEATLFQPTALNNDSASLHNKIFFALVDNVPAYDKNTGKDHATNRTNEIVFKKGTILSSQQWREKQKAPAQTKKPPAETKTQDTGGTTAPVASAAEKPPAMTPGKGKPAWMK